MSLLDWVAATLLFLQLPIPLFWLILHPRIDFWRRHVRAGYWTAGLLSWGLVAAFLALFHERLFASAGSPPWAIAIGLTLIAGDGYLFYRVKRELGRLRLIGLTELQGGGELLTQGLYAHVRHPRYTGMMLAVCGACLLAGSRLLWEVAALWWLLALTAVGLEERELRARFGAAYLAYSQRVPRFLPFRLRLGKE